MSSERRDSEIVSGYLESGDPALFEELMRRHWDRVVRIVCSVTGPEHAMDAEDLAQRVLIRAHQTLGGFRGESRFTSWLYRIAYNVAMDHTRRASRRARLFEKKSPAQDHDSAPAADESFLEAERDRVVLRAVDRIPHPYRSALRLFYWFDCPVREVAESLGVPVGTAKSYLHRGRKLLQRMLEESEVSP